MLNILYVMTIELIFEKFSPGEHRERLYNLSADEKRTYLHAGMKREREKEREREREKEHMFACLCWYECAYVYA